MSGNDLDDSELEVAWTEGLLKTKFTFALLQAYT